ncbi:MAG TPA: DUF493 domain-containing protein [Rhodothermales bacterium]|nr:DUF493 domain-containing protein [Rhodothermales bacterium]
MSGEKRHTAKREADSGQFKRLLDEQNDWPAPFTFKFIVSKDQLEALREVLDGYDLRTRESRNGNYLAITLDPVMESSEDVLRIYGRASKIKGIVSL